MSDTVETSTTEGTEAEEFICLDPSQIIIGSNVRTDLPDAKEFRKSIKERGVLEAVTVYRNDEGRYVCLRGQRRTVEAAAVGTPTGTIPCRVVAQPDDADRIGDQMVENIHRAGMRESEIVAGVEQLALLGVSAAQIAKRTAVARPTVNAALAVAKGEQSRARVETGDLTLDEAAIFAEFEDDPEATERLERARISRFGDSLEHVAQRLRDQATERAAYDAEVERLRGEGLPVLSADEADEASGAPVLEDMRTPEGEPVPEEEWPNVVSAAVIVTEEWEYPEPDEADEDAQGDAEVDDEDAYEAGYVEPVKVYRPVWVVTDVEASGLVHRSQASGSEDEDQSDEDSAAAEAAAEARRAERRRVIANNKAWSSAETVRREWLTGFVSRKSAPKGAEALICEAVVTGHHTLSKAMDHRHPMLFRLLGIDVATGYYGAGHSELHKIATRASTPKGATMTALAAVLSAWEDSTGKHTWRNPTEWDARVLGALMEWGYQPSDVERLLLSEDQADDEGTEDGDDESAEGDAADSAA